MVAAPLAGRAVLVTGGSSGIGQAIALAAARAGADVAVTYHLNERGARDVERDICALGRRGAAIHLNLADMASVSELAELGATARRSLGRLDVWINNAGADVLTAAAAALSPIQKLDLLLAVDLRGTVLASWQAADMFAAQDEGGVIINMSWDHVLTGMAAFSKSLARSVAPRVRVNIIAPGFIETAFGAGAGGEWRRAVVESTPLNRWGTPDDVAAAAVFLASPAAAFLTGQTILVGGGVVM
jgi:3-oxoacyl-[acyl-carrier protein] reductase